MMVLLAVHLPDVESVASKIHKAWMVQKHREGITSRLSEDNEELMIPYFKLSHKAKELDRASVKAVYAAIIALAHETTLTS